MNGLFFASIATLSTLEFKVHLSFLTLNISFFMFQTYKRDEYFSKESSSRLETGRRIVALTFKEQANLKIHPFFCSALMY